MDLSMFVNGDMGELVDIAGSDPVAGDWRHKAFIPAPLDDDEPVLRGSTHRLVAAGGSRTGAAPRARRATRKNAPLADVLAGRATISAVTRRSRRPAEIGRAHD